MGTALLARTTVLPGLLGAIVVAIPVCVQANANDAGKKPAGDTVRTPEPESLSALKALDATAASGSAIATQVLSPVREAALRDTANAIGVQAGLGDESRRIVALLRSRSQTLDERYRFNELLLGVGVLPPVISEARDAVAIEGPVMRVAQRIYRIDEAARFVLVAPTWRDWLLTGLAPDLRPQQPAHQLLPRDDHERAYWRSALDVAYQVGVTQARTIIDLNLSRLERTYLGMRRFLELHARGMVTAPQVIAADSVIDRDDPNTVVVGSTVFKIVQHTNFVDRHEQWRPLGR